MHTAYIALGSNLGDRRRHLLSAVGQLDAIESTRVEEASPVYETEAVTQDGSEGPRYLNAVLRIVTGLGPLDLLECCRRIELTAGRRRTPGRKWEARSLDLDILLFDEQTISTDRLTVPHPRMADRRFVLQPLSDLAPDLHLPDPYDVSVRYLLDRCTNREPLRPIDLRLLDKFAEL